MKKIIIVILFALSFSQADAQKIEGSWFGNANVLLTGSHNNYLFELNLKEDDGVVKGVIGYYFRNSYQTFRVKGTYNRTRREIYIKNIPVTYYQASSTAGVECVMDLVAMVSISKVSKNLKGVFTSHGKYKYTCPEISFDFAYGIAVPKVDQQGGVSKIWKPLPEEVVARPTAITQPRLDSPSLSSRLIADFNRRKEVIGQELFVDADSIRVTVYDNGDVDGDSVSLFYNKIPVSTRQSLSERGVNVYVALDSTREYNDISMYAENLGRIPPNTALMVITDGINRYEVFLSSSLTQNATVRLRRRK